MKSTKKKSYGSLIAGLVLVVALAVVFMRGDQLKELVHTIDEGAPLLLVLAVAFQLAKYLAQAASFTWCFKCVDAKLPFATNLRLVFQTFFMDTAVPSFNISGTSVVIEVASRHGIEPGRSTGAALLRQISISAGFVIVMLLGFAILLVRGELEVGWLILGIIAVVIVGVMVAAMALAAMKPKLVLKVAAPFLHVADRVLARLHKKPIDERAKQLVDTYAQSAKHMVGNKGAIAAELGLNVLANIFEILCFASVGLAFGVHGLTTAICVYVVATLAATISPIPQGVGVVEAASLVAFTLFGVHQAAGMAVIMVYRAIIFWLPFLIGALLMQIDARHHKPDANVGANAGTTQSGSTEAAA